MSLSISCRADDADKHDLDVNYLLFHKGVLYSAGDDGTIKAWSADLTKTAEVKAHPSSVYSLAASNDTLYSCSNDGTIKSWELGNLRAKATILEDKEIEITRVVYSNGTLISGDNEGNIKVFKNDVFYGSVNIAEPIKDLVILENLAFTVKETDVVVTELITDGENIQYGTKTTFWGRAPLSQVGTRLLAFASREGKDILLHELDHESSFKEVAKIGGAHEMIINALAGAKWNNQENLFSGGWDKNVKRWIIEKSTTTLDSSVDVDIVINAITTGEPGLLYAAGSDGHIVRITVN